MSVVNGQLELSIELPLVNSVSELDVDVSRTQLQLSSVHYALTVRMQTRGHAHTSGACLLDPPLMSAVLLCCVSSSRAADIPCTDL